MCDEGGSSDLRSPQFEAGWVQLSLPPEWEHGCKHKWRHAGGWLGFGVEFAGFSASLRCTSRCTSRLFFVKNAKLRHAIITATKLPFRSVFPCSIHPPAFPSMHPRVVAVLCTKNNHINNDPQVGTLGVAMVGLLLARDAARFVAAKRVGVELGKPLALPSFDTGADCNRSDGTRFFM